MFDVGFWELALIFMLGLMVLGPEKLPRIAAQVGRWVGRARRTATQLRYQLEREINLEDKPRAPYTPPPKTSQIVPPPGAQRPDSEAGGGAASDAAEAADAADAARSGDDSSPESERDPAK
jgi:sec-independent protein translocase protein TatB